MAKETKGKEVKKPSKDVEKASLSREYIVNIKGKDFVQYVGLLDFAHQKGLKSIQVDIIQFPKAENQHTAICKAVAQDGENVFSDIGDASPKNVDVHIAPHIIRMASTRAKARALRDYTNVGITALEEIMENGVIGSKKKGNKKKGGKVTDLSEKPAKTKEVTAAFDFFNELGIEDGHLSRWLGYKDGEIVMITVGDLKKLRDLARAITFFQGAEDNAERQEWLIDYIGADFTLNDALTSKNPEHYFDVLVDAKKDWEGRNV